MKSFCKKIHITYTLYFVIFLSLISGLFKDIACLFMIIILHELGHVISSFLFKWKIKKINIGICGGFLTYDDKIDKPFNEEIVIAISGFIMQIIIFIISYIFFSKYAIFHLINKYNFSILLFNLLPIVPLDGSKIINILLNKLFSYYHSLKLTAYISFFTLLIVIICLFKYFTLDFSIIMILSFIINKLLNYFKDIPYLFNKLLLEKRFAKKRYNKNFYVKSINLKKLRRQRNNYFYGNGRYHSELDILRKRFD